MKTHPLITLRKCNNKKCCHVFSNEEALRGTRNTIDLCPKCRHYGYFNLTKNGKSQRFPELTSPEDIKCTPNLSETMSKRLIAAKMRALDNQ